MPDTPRQNNAIDADFTLDLDQVFVRPAPVPVGPPATIRRSRPAPAPEPDEAPEEPQTPHHYKLERKETPPIAKASRISRLSYLPATGASLPDLPEGDESKGQFGRRKADMSLPELTTNRAFEVMKASSLFNDEELVDPHKFNRGLKICGLVMLLTFGVYMAAKLVQSSENLTAQIPVAVAAADTQGAAISAARQVLTNYLNTKSWKERSKFIQDPDRVGPKFRQYYEDAANVEPLLAINGKGHPQEVGGESWFTFLLEDLNTGKEYAATIHQTNTGPRLDWESFVGLGAIPWKEFCTTRPTEATQMRVLVRESEHYSGTFADTAKYQAFEIRHLSGGQMLVGYVDRSTRGAQALAATTAGQTKPVPVHLYLQCDPDTEPDQVTILDMVSNAER